MDPRKLAALGAARTGLLGGETVLKLDPAYKNAAFMSSTAAKFTRVQAELVLTETLMAASGVKNTILFFGSARNMSPAAHAHAVVKAEAAVASGGEKERAAGLAALDRLRGIAWMNPHWDSIKEISRRLTVWSMSRIGVDGRLPYVIATGGGPGFMEAANAGSASVEGAINLGYGIELPFEAGLNDSVTPELALTYRYFFTRKFGMAYWTRAFVVAPGGWGSFDELFEILTLLQTGKFTHAHTLPVVLFCASYWNRVFNWEAMAELGVISRSDLDRLFITDSVDDACAHVQMKLEAWEAATAADAEEAAHKAASEQAAMSKAAQAHLAFVERATAKAHAAAAAALYGKGGADMSPTISGAYPHAMGTPSEPGHVPPAASFGSPSAVPITGVEGLPLVHRHHPKGTAPGSDNYGHSEGRSSGGAAQSR